MKRAFDLVSATIAIAALAPALIALGIAVRLTSPGPALFRHLRVGKDNRPFEVLKFRTMRSDLEGAQITAAGDPRITPVGRVLRDYKLDELPQLINVIRGEMSIVGPRPEVARYVELRSEYQTILSVRPGLTDPASLAFRDEQDILEEQADPEQFYIDHLLPQKVGMSLNYVETRTFLGDLKLILATLKAILR